MTIPTISEIKGNTILQLLTNAYNTLKNAISGKQNKLIAGDNIVINEETNTISAIQGGTPVLDDYYTKEETNELLDEKADVIDVYNKTEIDTKLGAKADSVDVYDKIEIDNLISGVCEVIDATIEQGDYATIVITNEIKKGDIVVCNINTNLANYFNFVATSIEDNQSYKNASLSLNYIRTDANNYIKYFKQGFVSKYGDNDYRIKIMDITETVTNGASSIATVNYSTISAANSKVTIYRKKEETQ